MRRRSTRCSSRSTGSCEVCRVSRPIGRCYPPGGLWAAHSPAELWLHGSELLHIVDGHCVWTRADSLGQSDPAPWRSARHSHRDCGVHFGPDFSTQPRTRPATDCATYLATESVSESVSHGAVGCRTRPRAGCGADGAVDCTLVCRADSGVLPRVGFGGLPGAEIRAKSLIDGHIDGRIVLGLEPRSHPRIDPLIAGASAGSGSGSQAAGWDRPHSGLCGFMLRSANSSLLTANFPSPRLCPAVVPPLTRADHLGSDAGKGSTGAAGEVGCSRPQSRRPGRHPHRRLQRPRAVTE